MKILNYAPSHISDIITFACDINIRLKDMNLTKFFREKSKIIVILTTSLFLIPIIFSLVGTFMQSAFGN